MTKLLIDRGNTSTKFAIWQDNSVVHLERMETSWAETIDRLSSTYNIEECIGSSVAAPDEELDRVLGVQKYPCRWITSDVPCALKGIPQGYGVDRLVADLGAMVCAEGHPFLVIDAGTCITYDAFSAEGRLMGGAISAGVQLRLKAMHEHTALLPLFEPDFSVPVIGNDTRTAMVSSAIHGARFEIEGYIRHLMIEYPDLRVFMTGGNDFAFADDVNRITTHDPLLLFKGLSMF